MEKTNKKNILKKLTELQESVMWLQNETINKINSPIFYLEHLGPIYRVLTSLKKEIK